MIKRSLKITALIFAAALVLGGCGDTNSNNENSKTDNTSDSVSELSSASNDILQSSLSSQSGITYPQIVLTKDAAERELFKGNWIYPSENDVFTDPDNIPAEADKDAWYYGSSFRFRENGDGDLTIGKFSSLIKYKINDDLTISITRGNHPEVTEVYALGTHDKLGTVLYSKTDKSILFYLLEY